MRARLGTAAHFCKVVVLKLRTVTDETVAAAAVRERLEVPLQGHFAHKKATPP